MFICIWQSLRRFTAAVFAAICFCVVSCNNITTTRELLDANYLASGQSSVDLLSPLDNTGTGQNPQLIWDPKRGISAYKVEISPMADFSQTVLSVVANGNSYTVSNADLIGITKLAGIRYFWRVSAANLTPNLMSKTFSFQVPETGVYYVSTGSSAGVQTGNRTAPFQEIQTAISAADNARGGQVSTSMVIKVAAGSYLEKITLKAGLSIYGGYESTNWTRNIASNVTTINAISTTAISGAADITATYAASTVVDGFTITGGNVGGSASYAFFLNNSSPVITNNIINGGSGGSSFGIYMLAGSSPQVTNNTINGGSPVYDSTGLYIDSSSPTVTNNTINGGVSSNGSNTYGVNIVGSATPTLTNNTISGGASSFWGYGLYISSGATPVITGNTINAGTAPTRSHGIANFAVITLTRNTIHGGSGSGSSYAIYNSGNASIFTNNTLHGGTGTTAYGFYVFSGASPTISNNTINGGGGGTSHGIYILGASAAITNNIIFTIAGGTRNGVFEANSSSDPVSFQNNLIFDCPTALYRDEAASARTTEAQLNAPANTTQGTAASSSGNLGPASVANFAAVFFVSASDLHLTASSPLNVRCGGKDTSQSTCGSAGSSNCGGVIKDWDDLVRTASLTGTCVGASNTGAAGYSIGAYEQD